MPIDDALNNQIMHIVSHLETRYSEKRDQDIDDGYWWKFVCWKRSFLGVSIQGGEDETRIRS